MNARISSSPASLSEDAPSMVSGVLVSGVQKRARVATRVDTGGKVQYLKDVTDPRGPGGRLYLNTPPGERGEFRSIPDGVGRFIEVSQEIGGGGTNNSIFLRR